MSAAAFRYVPRPDANGALRERIVALAHRYRRYGAGMIHLKLRQEGRYVNHKRVERLYTEARLQVRRRRRKKVPAMVRQPLVRPEHCHDGWSADVVFGRTTEGRVLTCFTIVDDASTEAVAVETSCSMGGLSVTRVLDQLALTRGLPRMLRTDNGPKCCSLAMRTGAHARGGTLRLIEPGEPNQHAYVESFNVHLREECLNQHWFTSVPQARALIETWRSEYNDERPKAASGGLTLAEYAQQLTERGKRETVTAEL